MNAELRAQYLDQFHTHGLALPGHGLPWLAALRQQALTRFDATGFPSPREEEWKYTNIAPIEKKLFQPGTVTKSHADVDAKLIDRHRLDDAWVVAIVNGVFAPRLSRLDGVPAGVTISPIGQVLSSDPAFIETRLGKASADENHGFIAFNTAFFSEGLVLRVTAGQKLEKPVQMLHIGTDSDTSTSLRHVVVVESGAEAQLVETFAGTSESTSLCTSITEVMVEHNASLHHYALQQQSERTYHFGGVYAALSRNARYRHTNLSFGALLARNEIHTALDQGADCALNGLFLGRQRQHVDNHTLIQHRGPFGTSREHYRGILADRARGVFQGRIVVHPDAQKTDAQMNNRNLLLSEDAEIDTKPQLEIHADDVKCAHGVAIGRLDPEAVFFLRSRGVEAESARNMLTFAFANAMLEGIALDSLKSMARRQLMSHFPQSGIRSDWL